MRYNTAVDEQTDGPPGAPAPPEAAAPTGPSSADDGSPRRDRRGWIVAVAVAALVGALAGAGVGVVVARSIGAAEQTVIRFSSDTSVFPKVGDVQAVLSRVLPAVVAIKASGPACQGRTSPVGGVQVDEGTGMILTPGGEILTNNHVIAGATQISVTLYGQRRSYPAVLAGTDPTTDVALLQVRGISGLPTVSLGDSSTLLVGDGVLAIGNALALSESTPSVTEGIISAEGRSIRAGGGCAGTESLTGLLQTQAPINPGNSGGPLVDSSGSVIGMNTAAATSSVGNAPAQNIGFAIPIDSIKSLLPGLRLGGTIGPPKAFIGVEVVSVTPALRSAYGLTPTTGALIAVVEPGSPARAAGLEDNDVIVSFDGQAISTDTSLTVAVGGARPGQRVPVVVYRGSHRLTFEVTLGTKPAPPSGGG